jgi:alpha-D-ribose 1-methylphosphonate 5-triphosphate synthase subunit PhnI
LAGAARRSSVPELSVDQIREQMGLAVARVMNEGSLYDPGLAALALKQAQGDAIEAAFLCALPHGAAGRLPNCSG